MQADKCGSLIALAFAGSAVGPEIEIFLVSIVCTIVQRISGVLNPVLGPGA